MILSVTQFDELAKDVLKRERFTVDASDDLHFQGPNEEEIYWEIYHGRALDRTMTRQKQLFRAWNVRLDRQADEPLISLKWDRSANLIHVTRSVLCFAHEALAATGDVIESRETTRWMRELVGSLRPRSGLRKELSCLVFQAVVGTGRLPLTSLEAPLPAFTLGQLGYFPDFDSAEVEAKRLEFSLRSGRPQLGDDGSLDRLKQVFNGVSLSPYTKFVGRALGYLRKLEDDSIIPASQRLSFLCYLLRLQWRHLNAYDLVTFHHRGANYPDALLVEEVLREVLEIASRAPELFANRLDRRGLRLGWMLRTLYHDHLVPAQPTSPGENQRVLPEPFVRVPDEQIAHARQRPRRLFDQLMPTTAESDRVLNECLSDLSVEIELRELGTAVILDRPMGHGKLQHEPDRTPMFSHVACSRALAANVAGQLVQKDSERFPILSKVNWDSISFEGLSIPRLNHTDRPGVVNLTDAFKTADDFRVVRTTRSSLRPLIVGFDWSAAPAQFRDFDRWRVLLPERDHLGQFLRVFDEEWRPLLDLQPLSSKDFVTYMGVEFPAPGLDVRAFDGTASFRVLPREQA